jgi:hypothetical protein
MPASGPRAESPARVRDREARLGIAEEEGLSLCLADIVAMPSVPGLRSPYAKVGRLVFFGRMLDKIRLHSAGKLPADYIDNLGQQKRTVFDARCCEFLRVSYEEIRRWTLEGAADEAVLERAEKAGGRRTDGECSMWNCFMAKRGWHDRPDVSGRLRLRVAESGLEGKPIETFFDYIDFDEGRDPAAARAWESVSLD